MTPKSLPLTALLLCLLSAVSSAVQYALSIPARLNSGGTGKACVNLHCFEDTLDLSVVLEYGEINTIIFSEHVSPPTYFKCKEFQVPVVLEDVPVLVSLKISGEVIDISQRYSVVIVVLRNIYLVQMDKPVYKPGQKVLFNLISLNWMLLPVNETYSEVYLTDPSGSHIAQWMNLKADSGFVSIEYTLVDDAVPGYYYVTAHRGLDQTVMQWFMVEDYVSPRYEVTLDAPYTLSILDEALNLIVSARYTYGQPVPGTVSIRWCREPAYGRFNNCFKDKNGVCYYKTAQLAPDGTYHGEIDLTSIQMDFSGFSTSLNLSVTVTENGTEIQVTKTQHLWVTGQPARIFFDYDHMSQCYKRGLPYTVKVSLLNEKDFPIVNESVLIEIEGHWTYQTIITDSNGVAKYDIDTSNFFEPNFTIRASYLNTEQCYQGSWQGPDYPTAEFLVFRFYSVSGSFLQIVPLPSALRCGDNQSIEVQFLLSNKGASDEGNTVAFYYLVMSRTGIILSGQQEVDITCDMTSTFSFELQITSEMAFKSDLLVYTILHNEIISDTKSLNVEGCFKNEVSLSFSEDIGPPASNVTIKITASPGSLCAVKVIDSSILLLHPGGELTPESVFYSLQYWYYGYYVGNFNVEQPGPPCEDPNKQIFCDGNYYVPVSSDTEGDTYNNIKGIGLVMGTDATVRKPIVCMSRVETYPQPFIKEMGGPSPSDSGPQPMLAFKGTESVETIRRNFSDTWVWTKVYANDDGNGTISQTVPDTITEWKGSMICTSETDGFGMTKNSESFITFLPFFVEMSLPYSITRGENLILTASVSNYLVHCVKIEVILWNSSDYIATLQEGEQDKCICTGEKAYYKWNINATVLGVTNFTITAQTTYIDQTCYGENNSSLPVYKDTVSQSIIIEPEGIKKEVTSSHLICLQGNSSQNYTIQEELIPPPDTFPDSASAFLTVVGDITGLPIQNLQNLLQMPYGCGEQNLARMAPIPFLLDYLNVTDQRTDEILQYGIHLMTIGYIRELRYRLPSGAYSLFSGVNKEANARLTVYVFKTFEKCKKYIYIDDKIQPQTLIWLQNLQQLHSGCFQAIGSPFMTWGGEEETDVIFTAVLAIALMESDYSLGMTLLVGAMTCLQNVYDNNHDLSVYPQALMLYAFTLAQDWGRRESLLASLKSKATEEGGTIHWDRDDKPRPVDFFYQYSPAEVEICAYILLSLVLGPNVEQEMSFIAQVSVWLIRQQNPYGGFYSTQDTAVALQALSALAKLFFTPNAQQSIKVTGHDTITVNMLNRFLVQRIPLEIPGNYNVSITGTGCCLVQTTVRYWVPVPQENSTFLLSANTSSASCVNNVAYAFAISISVSYRGNRSQTNMGIVDITMISGYQADYWSLQELVNRNVISYFEIKNNHVIVYLKSVSHEATDFSVTVIMSSRVLNVKRASMYVYDYYETAENGYASYRHPCSPP